MKKLKRKKPHGNTGKRNAAKAEPRNKTISPRIKDKTFESLCKWALELDRKPSYVAAKIIEQAISDRGDGNGQ